MALLPLVEIVARVALSGGISGSIPIVQHLTLVITFVGAALAARDQRLLALSTAKVLPKGWEPTLRIFSSAAATGICAGLAVASWDLVQTEREFGSIVGWGIPGWVFLLSLPLGFAAVGGWLIWNASRRWSGRALTIRGAHAPRADRCTIASAVGWRAISRNETTRMNIFIRRSSERAIQSRRSGSTRRHRRSLVCGMVLHGSRER
jgi:TRAP-type C4-dicarboxylate transport system permease small subunit